eukprot:TRINITY_DN7371_c2_g1_i1.p1 TRINITY_DN7371_c2_g1~~TRINITY_DN7371_c2_g1_i1.p1  ORF type:complete len:108 (-),score=35.05 TRINITY_DN7371_c2_g1_i1:33-356(-)
MSLEKQIKNEIEKGGCVVFIKGSYENATCKFSKSIIETLNQQGITCRYFDVLPNLEFKQALKNYSNWPTIPQLFINGKLIGGCDIASELASNGQLKNIFLNQNQNQK